MLLGCWIQLCYSLLLFCSPCQMHRYLWSNLPLMSSVHTSVPGQFPSFFCNLGHTLQCNGSDPPLKSETYPWCHGFFDKSSLAWCKYISSSSSGSCCKLAKAWIAWMLKGFEENSMESLLLSSLHVKFGDPSLNLWAEVRFWDSTNFRNAICKMSWPEIHAAFWTDAIHASNLFLLPLKVSTEDITVWMMAWSMITHIRRLT